MIDINTIVQQALATAIEQIMADQLTVINQRISSLALRVDNLTNSVTTDSTAQTLRIAALETQLNTSTLTPLTHEYIAKVAREAVATTPALTEERVVEIARAAADEAITEHAENYNHEEYDRVCDMLGDYDLDDFVSEDDLSRKVRGCVKDLTFTVSVEVE